MSQQLRGVSIVFVKPAHLSSRFAVSFCPSRFSSATAYNLDCRETCIHPISTHPASTEAYGLTLACGTCFAASHVELGAVAVPQIVWVARDGRPGFFETYNIISVVLRGCFHSLILLVIEWTTDHVRHTADRGVMDLHLFLTEIPRESHGNRSYFISRFAVFRGTPWKIPTVPGGFHGKIHANPRYVVTCRNILRELTQSNTAGSRGSSRGTSDVIQCAPATRLMGCQSHHMSRASRPEADRHRKTGLVRQPSPRLHTISKTREQTKNSKL